MSGKKVIKKKKNITPKDISKNKKISQKLVVEKEKKKEEQIQIKPESVLNENIESVLDVEKTSNSKTNKKQKKEKVLGKSKKTKQKQKKISDKNKRVIDKKKLIIIISAISLVVVLAVAITLICIFSNKNKSPYLTRIDVVAVGKTSGYQAFDQFDDDGLAINAIYSDGSFSRIEEGFEISYVGIDETYHTDHFYGGETKVRIGYGGHYSFVSVDEIAKVNREITISLDEYSQIATGMAVDLPQEYLDLRDLSGSSITNVEYELVYCSNFVDYSNYEPTAIVDGATALGKAPSQAGNYKVFAKVAGDNNYNELISNVVELAIVDEQDIDLCAGENEEFFAFREDYVFGKSENAYVQFEIETENNIKVLKYYSSFAGNGSVMIFSDHITLLSANVKTQILFENGEILINNSERILKKWKIPNYLGTYELVVTPEYLLENYGLVLSQNKTCKLDIYVEEENKEGKIYFKFDLLWKNGEQPIDYTIEGEVNYSINQNGIGNLSFDYNKGDRKTNLFLVSNISENQMIMQLLVSMSADEAKISNGIYFNVLAN